jgi:hypothetical protein
MTSNIILIIFTVCNCIKTYPMTQIEDSSSDINKNEDNNNP